MIGGTMLETITWTVSQLPVWGFYALTILGAVSLILSTAGAFFPAGSPAGEWFKRASIDVRWFASQLANVLPKAPPPTALLLLLALPLCLASTACAGSFEVARHGGQTERLTLAAAGVPVTPADRSHCEAIDGRYQVWSALAKGGAALTGSAGLSTIPVDDQGARIGIAIGAAVVGSFTAAAVAVADGASQEWARECSTP
jgi:hypothetical protein